MADLPILKMQPLAENTRRKWGPPMLESFRMLNDLIEDLRSRGADRVAVGDYLLGSGVIEHGAVTPAPSTVLFSSVEVSLSSTYSHVAYRIAANAVGGQPALSFAIYPDNGSGRPDTTKRLGITGTDDLKEGTNKELPFQSLVVLKPGRYWVASLYTAVVQPNPVPQLHMVSRAVTGWSTAGIFWFNGALPALSLKLTGRTSLPNAATTPEPARDSPVFFGLKRSA